MKEIILHILGYSCLSFSIIGFVHIGIEFWQVKAYTLSRAIIYCVLFGVGIALL